MSYRRTGPASVALTASTASSTVYADVLVEQVNVVQDDLHGWYDGLQIPISGMDVIEHALPAGFDTQKFLALLQDLH